MNDIEALLKVTIETKVIEAFNSTPEMVEKLVKAALSKEVNQHGAPPTGFADKKMPFMEWLVGEEIRRAVVECVRAYIKENTCLIRDRVSVAIQGADFATPLAKTLSEVVSQDFVWSVNLDLKKA